MLTNYKKAGNAALGATVVCFITIGVLGRNSSNGNVWGPGGAPPMLMYLTVLSILATFWSYAKAKGYSGWLGAALPLLNIIGLVALLSLKDKHPETLSPESEPTKAATKKLATGLFIAVGLAALAYVFYTIKKIGG